MKLLVFQHIACEHPGIFRRFLAADGVPWSAVEIDAGEPIPPLEDFDALWVMGGPMDVWDLEDCPWLADEKRAIRHWVNTLKRPFLGICLGHQLLADALGGTCGPQRPPDVGVLDIALTEAGRSDPLLKNIPALHKALQWQSVRVAQPPEGAVVLAKSALCPVQAIRVGSNAWGFQYHVELETDTIPNWGCIPAYEAALETSQGPGALDRMIAAATPHMQAFEANARTLYANFMTLAGGR